MKRILSFKKSKPVDHEHPQHWIETRVKNWAKSSDSWMLHCFKGKKLKMKYSNGKGTKNFMSLCIMNNSQVRYSNGPYYK